MKILDVPRSGSYQGVTSSRNRFGQYVRSRATPVNPNSSFQGQARARLSAFAAAWRQLTDVQRVGWESLGAQMQRTDSLGSVYTLNGFMAFVSVNTNRAAAGDAQLDDAPVLVTPSAPLTATLTITAATFTIAYTPTPLGASERLFAFVSPQLSVGRNYWSDFRLIQVSAAAAASPLNVFTAYQARLGTPVVDNKIIAHLQTYNTGFLSGPIIASAVVA
jgi:hypothetical protein